MISSIAEDRSVEEAEARYHARRSREELAAAAAAADIVAAEIHRMLARKYLQLAERRPLAAASRTDLNGGS